MTSDETLWNRVLKMVATENKWALGLGQSEQAPSSLLVGFALTIMVPIDQNRIQLVAMDFWLTNL